MRMLLTGHWQAPAGHWHEAPQLQVWSGPDVVLVSDTEAGIRGVCEYEKPRHDPAMSHSP